VLFANNSINNSNKTIINNTNNNNKGSSSSCNNNNNSKGIKYAAVKRIISPWMASKLLVCDKNGVARLEKKRKSNKKQRRETFKGEEVKEIRTLC